LNIAPVILRSLERGRARLVFPLLILLLFGGALALAGPGGTPAPAQPQSSEAEQLDSDELARISVDSLPTVARQVEDVRDLKFDRLPKPEVVSSDYLNRLGERESEQQAGGLGVGADQAVGEITGLISHGEDLGAAYTSTGDLAAAAYDSKTKRLYIVSDAVAANKALVEFVLAHELNHALEDQNFGIGGGAKLDDDGALARQALVEGSATDVMIEFAAQYLNPLELLAASDTIDQGTGDVPKAIVDQLTWTYIGGRRFIQALRAYGGGWKLVDYALGSRPPATTEQVLHPTKYIHDELPSPVRVDGAELRNQGWRPSDRSGFGELATDYLLRVGAEPETAKGAAAGWDGDRYELWRRDVAPGDCASPCRGDLALVAKWAWDTPGDAEEFDHAARAYVEDGLQGAAVTTDVWRVEGGYVALAGSTRESALVFALEADLARSVAAAQVGT
jgi:hypothetical protein